MCEGISVISNSVDWKCRFSTTLLLLTVGEHKASLALPDGAKYIACDNAANCACFIHASAEWIEASYATECNDRVCVPQHSVPISAAWAIREDFLFPIWGVIFWLIVICAHAVLSVLSFVGEDAKIGLILQCLQLLVVPAWTAYFPMGLVELWSSPSIKKGEANTRGPFHSEINVYFSSLHSRVGLFILM